MVSTTDLASPTRREGPRVAGFRTVVFWIVALGAIILDVGRAARVSVGQPRIFFAIGARWVAAQWAAKISPIRRVPYITTISPAYRSLWASIASERDLQPDEHRDAVAFALVSVGVLVLRAHRPNPAAPVPRCRGVRGSPALGAAVCVLMLGLPLERGFASVVWLAIGLAPLYGRVRLQHSKVRQNS